MEFHLFKAVVMLHLTGLLNAQERPAIVAAIESKTN
jgi:hypothetical protein